MENSTLLSIITINYNNATGLNKTMDSVKAQGVEFFEHIIIDGNSTDNSLDIIKSYNYLNITYKSEPDSGIYNAMNKGLKIACGKYILFLNSGDIFYNSKVLQEVTQYFNLDVSFLSGHMLYTVKGEEIIRKHPKILSFNYLITKTISHPSTFIKKEMFNKYGLYNEANKIVSDWEFFFKVLGLNGESYKRIDHIISVFDMTGISSRQENFKINKTEREAVFNKYLRPIFNDDLDTFLFRSIGVPSKRIKYLFNIEKSKLLRKVVTILLSILNLFSKK